jgi:hypothetical protein
MKILVLLLVFAFPLISAAQLNGTYKIGTPLATGCGGGACNYTTLTAPTGAFAAVNAQGISGNVIFEIYTDLAETGATVLTQFTDVSGPHTITIRPSAASMRILSGSKSADGLIAILGGDRVIIDGRDPGDATLSYTNRYLTVRNTSTSGPAINIGNDAVSVSIRSVILESRNATSTGVFNVGGGSISGNDDLTIDYCDIKNDATDATNLPQYGINMAGGATQGNDNIQVTNNRIYNFFISTGSPAGGTGINIGNYNSTVTITNNSIYQDADRTTNVNVVYRGIYVNSSAGNGFRISNNFIGSHAAGAAGSLSTISATGNRHVKASLIEIADVGFSSLTLVNGNTIRGFATSNTSSAGIADAGLIGISIARGYIDVRDNIIGDATGGLTANYDATSAACSGVIAGIGYMTNTSGTGLQGEIEGNFINNLVLNSTGATASGASEIAGIYIDQQTGTNTLTVKNNLIGQLSGTPIMTTNNNSTNAQNVVGIDISRASVAITLDRNKIANISSQGTAASSYTRGISSTAAGDLSVSSNEIFDISSDADNSSTTGAAVGIYASNTSATSMVISKNAVHDITNPNGVIVSGIVIGSVASGVNPRVENNMITLGNSLTTDAELYGIYNGVTLSAGTVQVYANSVVITGAGNGGNTNNTGGFWRDGNTVFDLQANLFLNKRTGGGNHYALGTTSNTTGTSDYNLLYSSNSANLAFTLALGARSFAQWNTLGQDVNSQNFDISPKFISITTGNLRIPDDGSLDVTTYIVDKGAATAASNPVNDDIDKAHRTNVTDIGASEVLVTWLGVTNTDWNTSTNWSGGVIPSCGGRDLIKIGPGVPNQPDITVAASFKELVILEGATVTLSGGGSLDQCASGVSPYSLIVNGTLTVSSSQPINLYGDFYQNATFNPATGTVSLLASSSQLIDGDEDPILLNNLTIDGGGAKTLNQEVKISGTLALNNGIVNTSLATVLTFTSTGTYSGGGTTSYISGPAAKETSFTTPFYFPIGKAGKFRPAAIEPSNTTATTFTAEYFAQSATATIGSAMEASLTNVSNIEYWKIDRGGTGSASGYIHLTWDPESYVSGNQADRDLLSAVRWDGSQWVNGYQIANAGDGSNGELTSGYIFVYNTYFTLGSSTLNNPLPVELVNFNAKAIGSKVKITWETLSERDNDHFMVEVSADGEKFRSISSIAGHGTTKDHLYYSLWDNSPPFGVSYYRLVQVDLGGHQTYSQVRKVEILDVSEPILSLSPNPVTTTDINFQLSAFGEDSIVALEIFDLSGRKLSQFELHCNSSGFAEADFSHNLPQGFYIIKAVSTDFSAQTKIVVK